MKFRAVLHNPRVLRDIADALSSLRKTCQLRLSPESVKLISSVSTSSTQVWTNLAVKTVFEECQMSSVEDNNMAMELNVDSLYRALKSSTQADGGFDDVVVRLKKHDRVVYMEVMFVQRSADGESSSIVTQELPVKLMKMKDALTLKEPVHPEPDVYIMLPNPMAPFLKICDRYRQLSTAIKIQANKNGQLNIETDTNDVSQAKVSSTWRGMKNVRVMSSNLEEESEDNDTTDYSVIVNSKEWWSVLQVKNVVTNIVMGICDQHALILYCYVSGAEQEQDGVLTYYISSYES